MPEWSGLRGLVELRPERVHRAAVVQRDEVHRERLRVLTLEEDRAVVGRPGRALDEPRREHVLRVVDAERLRVREVVPERVVLPEPVAWLEV